MAVGSDFAELISELPKWNNGAGIDPESWVGCSGSFELAIGYSLVFWPRFVEIDGYVLREGCSRQNLQSWKAGNDCERQSIEAVMNHLHIADIQHFEAAKNEAQLRFLGRVLKEIHETKLQRDFPNRAFTVTFNDEPGLDLIEYQLTFYQNQIA